MEKQIVIQKPILVELCENIFAALGVPGEDAGISADILVTADARGIKSHGVARIKRYVAGIKSGSMNKNAVPRTFVETAPVCSS